jgi:hypothetical protein
LDTPEERALPQAAKLQPCGGGAFRTAAGPIMTLSPLCDLMNVKDAAHRARSKSAQVLFKD